LAYVSPFLIALRRLNGYNTAEFSRDASLISIHFLIWSTALLSLLPALQGGWARRGKRSRDSIADWRGL
jgi:hypothetical protein